MRPRTGKPAGRPKARHTILTEQFRKHLIERLVAEQDPIIDALIKNIKAGKEKSIEMGIERIIGRPITPVDFQGEGIEALTDAINTILSQKK